MTFSLLSRFVREIDPRLLVKCAWNMGMGGMKSVRAFEKRRRRGEYFPAFLFISVTSQCNLHCQGCWVSADTKQVLAPECLDRIIREAKTRDCRFFGILGGEPLMYPRLVEVLSRHPECYFQVFTNGTLLTEAVAKEFRRLGNVTPLISLEGLEEVSDQRRGGAKVYQRSLQGLENCRRARLLTGVATSVCKSNFRDLVNEDFAREVGKRGAHYLWYYIYRPVGPNPCTELCLSEDEILTLRRFIVDVRLRVPIMVVDAYWDHEGRAMCPAATGISHHIGPGGDLEPCPPLQFARDRLGDGSDLTHLIENSAFLEAFRRFSTSQTRGCVLLDCPERLYEFLQMQQAHDTSGRRSAYEELARMKCQAGHHLPGREVPERHWAYRFAKKHWFFGFGAYG